MAFTRFLRAAIANDTIRVFGSGEQVRDFTFIDDVVEANVLAATAEHAPGAVFNVAGGAQASVNEVLEIVAELAEHPLDIERLDVAAGDVSRTSGSTDLIEAELGWRATTTVTEGLRAQHAWALASAPLLSSSISWK
jgi:nucleoside-diphosphate-sugar epimerase